MHEVTVKYKNSKSLKALQDLAKAYDMVIEEHAEVKEKYKDYLPIRFSENPDVTALVGIWKDNPITPEELRKRAWGNRFEFGILHPECAEIESLNFTLPA